MRLIRVKIVRVGLVCAAMLLVMGTISAAGASAVEGPYYKVKGARLNGNKSIAASIATEYLFKITVLGLAVSVKCKEMSLAAGATITGLNAKSSDTSKETIILKMCTVTGNGATCAVENNEIKTLALINVLAYSEEARKGEILVWFHPEVGKEIVNIKFVGGCFASAGKLEGSFAGELLNKKRENILVGGLQAEESTAFIKFPVSPIKKVWIEALMTEKEEPVAMTFMSNEATIKGESLVGNVNGGEEPWSVYTI
jgi:hypothetical protein